MSPARQESLAAHFLAWLRSTGHSPWDEAWEVWAAVIGLQEEDARAVRGIALAELIARGVVVPGPDYDPGQEDGDG